MSSFSKDFFLPITLSAESWIHIDFKDWDNDAFNGVDGSKVTLGICFLLGPWQFIPSLYRRNPMLHLHWGNVYVMLSLLLAAPAFVISAFSRVVLKFSSLLLLAVSGGGVHGRHFYISNKKMVYYILNGCLMAMPVSYARPFSLTNEGLHTATLFAIRYLNSFITENKGITPKVANGIFPFMKKFLERFIVFNFKTTFCNCFFFLFTDSQCPSEVLSE